MIEELPIATFTLSTYNANSNNGSGTQYTWNNINMEAILGQLFYKYEFFTLSLVSIAMTSNGNALSGHDRNFYITMTGLQWENSSYYWNEKTNKIEAGIGCISPQTFLTSSPEIITMSEDVRIAFNKGSSITDLTINLYKIYDGTQTIATGTPALFPNTIFIFKIIPVPEYKYIPASLFFASHRGNNIGQANSVPTVYAGYSLKTALGNLWDKWDIFEIELVRFAIDGTSAPSANNSSAEIQLKGLPYINPSNYDITANAACFGHLTNVSGVSYHFNGNSMFKNYFSKHFTTVDITISYLNWIDNITLVTGATYNPRCAVLFKIRGVHKFDN